MNYETELKCYFKNELNESDKIENKQHDNNRTLEMTKEIRVSVLIKGNRTLDQEKRSKSCYNSKRIKTKTLISNIHKIRRTKIHKRLSRRPIS